MSHVSRRQWLKHAATGAAGVIAAAGLTSIFANDSQLPGVSANDPSLDPENDRSVVLRFFGSPTADLFSREIAESFQAVLHKNYVTKSNGKFPAGFIHASLPGWAWYGTMWSRDGGTFLRELVMWGYYNHAACLAECLMRLVQKNREGFYSFPEYFEGSKPGTGTELDGTATIIIGMVVLWQRLPHGHPTRERIHTFLYQDGSPVKYLQHCVKTNSLVAGSGEFGGGCGIPGDYYNVVQNGLVMLALCAAANMSQQLGDIVVAEDYRALASKVMNAMEKHLTDGNGCWIWCINPKTMQPDSVVINHEINRGFGGLNGVACMYSDVLGFEPLASAWKGAKYCENTFMHLYHTPLRKSQFEKYGIWPLFDVFRAGMSSGPSYGDGYALQTMLLYDKLDMADRSLAWLANSTYKPVPEYKVDRESPYYFYERSYSPDAVGKTPLEQGCGALNLINVTEPMKVARLILGVDDSATDDIRLLPRVPPSWKGVEARNWPIRTPQGVVRADILFEKKGAGAELTLKVASDAEIPALAIRMPFATGYTWHRKKKVRSIQIVT